MNNINKIYTEVFDGDTNDTMKDKYSYEELKLFAIEYHKKQLEEENVTEEFYVFEKLDDNKLKQISVDFDNIEDAEGFIETMKGGFKYKNSNLKILKAI